jgi:lantibiotic leader peptide-processing serine protease
MNRHAPKLIALAVAALALQACQDQRELTEPPRRGVLSASVTLADPAGHHLVVFTAERVPADFGDRVVQLGGSVESALDGIGVAAVTGLSEGAAAELAANADIRAVEPDVATAPPNEDVGANGATADAAVSELLVPADATASPTAARFYARQWNLRAVSAPAAWAAGFLGSRDVVVAILDTGIDYTNPDLAGLVDLDRSISLVPEDVTRHYPGRLPFSDLFWHGTAVASAVASNAKVLAGVNRYVTLLAVKIADSTGLRTTASLLLNGIVYATDQGADVINVSNGIEFDKSAHPGIVAAFERAVNYAFRKGTLVVSVPFNDAADLDHNGDLVRLPCEAANAICAAATGPTGASGVNGPWVDVDAPAPYTAFGRSAISVAAPGGTGDPGHFRRFWALCTTTPSATTVPPACRAHQPIVQGAGTSFAAPTVAGLAALLVAQLGHGNPALIRARILQSADDLGQPGTDPFYGKGRINIARALGVLP